MTIRNQQTGCSPPFAKAAQIGTGDLPQTFVTNTTLNGTCDAAVYLGR